MKKLVTLLILGFVSLYATDLDKAIDLYDNKKFKEAETMFNKLCELNNTKACFKLAYLYENKDEKDRDLKKAFELYKKSCELGDAKGCFKVGVCYDKGGIIKVKKDNKIAEEYYKKSCEGGFSLACYNLGEVYQFYYKPKENKSKMIDVYKKACENGAVLGCYKLGNIYAKNKPFLAMEWYKVGCDQEDKESCFRLGDLQIKFISKIDPKDFKNLLKEYTEKCDKGDGLSCYREAVFYSTGRGVRQSYKKANKVFWKSCEMGDKISCMEYLMLNELGY